MQVNAKKIIENTYLNLFLSTEVGKCFWQQQNIVRHISSEAPDFLFTTSSGKIIGLELTNLTIQTEGYFKDKFIATASLHRVANKICEHFKKQRGIAISIIIDVDPLKKFTARTMQDTLRNAYNPGFTKLNVSERLIKDTIIKELSIGDIPKWGVQKRWLEIGPHWFKITYSRTYEPNYTCHVNNAGRCAEDPFEELQNVINNKNEKHTKYMEKCAECHLLVVSDNGSTGNFINFTDTINSQKFNSLFNSVYLLDLGSSFSTKAIKITT